MANKKVQQQDVGIPAVQKIITLGLIAMMAYVYFSGDRGVAPEAEKAPVRVKITDTTNGTESYTDLNAGKIFIGKWVIELAPEEVKVEPEAEVETDEKSDVLDKTSIPEAIDAPMSIPKLKE